MAVAIVIPARLASSRLPAKMLLADTGKPLIQHTFEQACQAKLADRVVIATDDPRIQHEVRKFGGEVVLTCPNHPTGTDRLAEVASKYLSQVDCIINVQGDEPEVSPMHIDALIELFQASDAAISTLVTRFASHLYEGPDSPLDPNRVKAILGENIYSQKSGALLGQQALYFSRSLVPYPREDKGIIKNPADYFQHLGIYAYRPDFLMRYVTLPRGPLEKAENLEQLRALEHGFKIVAREVAHANHGVDTLADYEAFVRRYQQETIADAV